STFCSTVESLSGRKLHRSAQARSPRRRSTLAGCTDSLGMRQAPARIQSSAIASRRRCAGSTPLAARSGVALTAVAPAGSCIAGSLWTHGAGLRRDPLALREAKPDRHLAREGLGVAGRWSTADPREGAGVGNAYGTNQYVEVA